jgi:hypothetical protein
VAFLLGTDDDDRPTFESQAAYFENALPELMLMNANRSDELHELESITSIICPCSKVNFAGRNGRR